MSNPMKDARWKLANTVLDMAEVSLGDMEWRDFQQVLGRVPDHLESNLNDPNSSACGRMER